MPPRRPLAYVPNRPLIRGWDVPGPVGVVWLQRVPFRPTGPGQGQNDGFARCHVLAEFLMDGSVEEAGRQALALTQGAVSPGRSRWWTLPIPRRSTVAPMIRNRPPTSCGAAAGSICPRGHGP